MNYRITVSDGKNEIDRWYEESFFGNSEVVGEAVQDMTETLKTPYPKEWDKECRKRGIPDLEHTYPEMLNPEK